MFRPRKAERLASVPLFGNGKWIAIPRESVRHPELMQVERDHVRVEIDSVNLSLQRNLKQWIGEIQFTNL